MATIYVNSITGNDANSGASPSLAKRTISAAVDVAGYSDTLRLTGVFTEDYLFFNKTLILQGPAIHDGQGTNRLKQTGGKLTFRDMVFMRQGGVGGVECGYGSTWFESCEFSDMANGYYGSEANFAWLFNCRFHTLTNGVRIASYYGCNVRSSAFGNNTRDIYGDGAVGGSNVSPRGCVFTDPVMIECINSADITSSDYNIYDFTSGGTRYVKIPSTTFYTYTSLRDWYYNDWSSRDVANSAALLGDPLKGALRLLPNSPYLLTGELAIGPSLPGVAFSTNANSSYWGNNGTHSNTQVDGSGDIVLSSGTSGAWTSPVIDLGGAVLINRIEIATKPGTLIDYDTGDTPGKLNIRFRGSREAFNAGDASPSWQLIEWNGDLRGVLADAYRYVQLEITMRNSGAGIRSFTLVVPGPMPNASVPIITPPAGGGGGGGIVTVPPTNWRAR